MDKTANEVPSAMKELVERSRTAKKKEVPVAQKKAPKSETITMLIHIHPEYQTALRLIKARRQITEGYTTHGGIIEEMLDDVYPNEVAEAKKAIKNSK